MASSNKAHFYPTVGKSSRSSPGYSQNNHGVFPQTSGGRTLLPPLSDFFPTSRSPGLFFPYRDRDPSTQNAVLLNTVPAYSRPYTQNRSPPNKLGYDLNPQVVYGAYPATGACE